MYQPRRVSDAVPAVESESDAVAFRFAPRRAARTRADFFRTRLAPAAVSVALLATSGAFALNLAATEQSTQAVPAPVRDEESVSRDAARELLETTAPVEEQATDALGADEFVGGTWATAFGASAGQKYAQVKVGVHAQASADSEVIATLSEGSKVTVTDKVESSWRQVIVGNRVGYVAEWDLGNAAPVKPEPKPAPKVERKAEPKKAPAPKAAPKAEAPAAKTPKAEPKKEAPKQSAPKADTYSGSSSYSGPSVLGLKPRAMVVYNAVTAKWSFSSIGGYRASSLSNHQYGGAIDFMLTPGRDSAKGWAVANYLASNAGAFNIDHIIFEQKIWTPYKPYWRAMENRGSVTANHYDHVHVSVKL